MLQHTCSEAWIGSASDKKERISLLHSYHVFNLNHVDAARLSGAQRLVATPAGRRGCVCSQSFKDYAKRNGLLGGKWHWSSGRGSYTYRRTAIQQRGEGQPNSARGVW